MQSYRRVWKEICSLESRFKAFLEIEIDVGGKFLGLISAENLLNHLQETKKNRIHLKALGSLLCDF